MGHLHTADKETWMHMVDERGPVRCPVCGEATLLWRQGEKERCVTCESRERKAAAADKV